MGKNRWARLSQSEKAELLGIYANGGWTKLDDIMFDYNMYAEGGPEKSKFQTRDNTKVAFTPQQLGYIPAENRPLQDRSNIDLDEGITGYAPVVGDILQGGQALSDFLNKNYRKAVIGAGLLLTPNILEKPIKAGLKFFKKALTKDGKFIISKLVNITDAEWDDAYKAAIKSGNDEEIQAIRDLHFISKATDSETLEPLYHSTNKDFTIFNPDVGKVDTPRDPFIHVGTQKAAEDAGGKKMMELFVNQKNPLKILDESQYDGAGILSELYDQGIIERPELDALYKEYRNTDKDWTDYIEHRRELQKKSREILQRKGYDGIKYDNVVEDKGSLSRGVLSSNQLKLRDAKTFDDSGNLIPLSKRDNFNNPDIRYGLIPIGAAGVGYSIFNNIESDNNQFKNGGPKNNSGWNIGATLIDKAKKKYLQDYINHGAVYGYPGKIESNSPTGVGPNQGLLNYVLSPYIGAASEDNDASMVRRALLSKYLGIEDGLRFNPSDYIEESPYKPSISSDTNAKYYRMKDTTETSRRSLFDSAAGSYKISNGTDENGRRYVSFYDVWDLSPVSKNSGKDGNDIPGTTPIELYDRFYEDEDPDYYYRVVPEDAPEEYKKQHEFVPLDFASGGKIHIKPENRGKFTALKKRTGHSASWFKAHGTPAQKKMAVFALNARKWKHADGGPLAITSQYIRDPQVQPRIETVRLPNLNIKMPEANIETPISFDLAPELYNMVPLMYDIPTVTVPFISGQEVEQLDPVKDAARRIRAVENSKTNPNGGWNEKEKRWYPHKSVEGGADTIAYGIKLSNGTPEAELAKKQGYLTDEQAVHFTDSLAQVYYDKAKSVYDKKYGDGEWDKLSPESQSFLTDFSYNPGLGKFPKLMEGFHSGDIDMIRKNYMRYSNGKPLGRNKIMLGEIEKFGSEVPIFRKCGGKIKKYGGKITQFSDISSIF